ncbi:MAG TPA: GNAT family N-acetyltransferase [Natronosporangium sp.]|nr:GNAT family N-acetyltransferase [Natronosporangium sp.]
MLTLPVRQLGDSDRRQVERILDRDPYGAVTVAELVAVRGLSRWRGGDALYGYGGRTHLEAVCWAGAHVTPVGAGPAAVAAFAELLAGRRRRCSSIIGHADAVLELWRRLEPSWGPARDVRPDQPLLVADAPSPVAPDPEVRLARPAETDLVWPAAVRMYTEEVGVSPLAEDGGRGHRARVSNLVRAGRTYVRVADGRVIFKADLAAVSRHTAQVQGVWVAPDWRNRGVGTGALAAVVRDVLERVAPTVSLYVNAYNHPARRVYQRCGFRQVGTFATVLF